MYTTFNGQRINIRRIGILTGGGDCAGLNAVIAGLWRCMHRANQTLASDDEISLVGLYDGWKSLLADNLLPSNGRSSHIINWQDVQTSFRESGTFLYSSRTNIYSDVNIARGAPKKVMENIKKLGLDCLCVLGGDDTLGAAKKLQDDYSYPVLGAPKTMDNDIHGTEKTFGFESAYIEAARVIANIQATARSHHRIFVVEVMGRHAGWVALFAGVAAGAGITLLPEEELDLDKLASRAKKMKEFWGFGTIVVSEGVQIFGQNSKLNAHHQKIVDDMKSSPKFAVMKARIESIKEFDSFGHPILSSAGAGEIITDILKFLTPDIEYRFQNCGHAIRAYAHAPDIILGLRFGNALFQYIQDGRFGIYPCLEAGKIIPKPLSQAKGGKFVTESDTTFADLISMKNLIDFFNQQM